MGSLTGKRALITGSSSGIGAETARLFADAGAAVVVLGRNVDKLAGVEKELRAMGADVASVVGDLSTIAGAQAVADAALGVGPIDILVNNAGGQVSPGGMTNWFGSSPEEWISCYHHNVISTVVMTQALVPAMKERGWGRVISTASAIVENNYDFIPEYKSAKSAVVALTLSLAKALGGTGVTANAVSPGSIITEMMIDSWLTPIAEQQGLAPTDVVLDTIAKDMFPDHLAQRMGRPHDIARGILFLAEPAADYVTGINLRIDGGLVINKGEEALARD